MKVSKTTLRGRPVFVLDLGRIGGHRRRSYFPTEELAISALERARARGDLLWFESLSEQERSDSVLVLSEIRERGLTLRRVWESFRASPGPCERVSIREAISETVRVKIASNRRRRYVDDLETFLLKFALGQELRPIESVSSEELDRWLDELGGSPGSRKVRLGMLGSLFGVARRRGWIPSNPVESLDVPTIERPTPRILSPSECETVLRVIRERRPAALSSVCLGMFAGVRPEELLRIRWDDLDLDSGTLTIAAAASKVRRRRLVPLSENLREWLALARTCSPLPLPAITLRRALRIARDALSLPGWPRDTLRASCASYWVHKAKDLGSVALALGNSPEILRRHYLELTTDRDASRFWRIRPGEPDPAPAPAVEVAFHHAPPASIFERSTLPRASSGPTAPCPR